MSEANEVIRKLQLDMDRARLSATGDAQAISISRRKTLDAQTGEEAATRVRDDAREAAGSARKLAVDLQRSRDQAVENGRALLAYLGYGTALDAADPRVIRRVVRERLDRPEAKLDPAAIAAELRWPPDGGGSIPFDAIRVLVAAEYLLESKRITPVAAEGVLRNVSTAFSSVWSNEGDWRRVHRLADVFAQLLHGDASTTDATLASLAAEPNAELYSHEAALLAAKLNDMPAAPFARIQTLLAPFTAHGTDDPSLGVESAIASLGAADPLTLPSSLATLVPGDPGWRPLPDRLDCSPLWSSAVAPERVATARLLASWRRSGVDADALIAALAACTAADALPAERLRDLRAVAAATLAQAGRVDDIIQLARSVDASIATPESRRLVLGALPLLDATPRSANATQVLNAAMTSATPAELRSAIPMNGSVPSADLHGPAFADELLKVSDDILAGHGAVVDYDWLESARVRWDPATASDAERKAMITACRYAIRRWPERVTTVGLAYSELAATVVDQISAMKNRAAH